MLKNKKVSRKDVAIAAGVSTTTVTHSLTDNPATRISEKTRQKVKRIAKELGYRPNFTGRVLVDGKTYSVGILQPAPEKILVDFYQQIIFGLVEPMSNSEYNLSLFFSHNNHYLDMLRQGRVDGLFVLDSVKKNEYINRLVELNIPMVALNHKVPSTLKDEVATVCSDNEKLAKDIVKHFMKIGCKNILTVNSKGSSYTNMELFNYFSKLQQHYSSDSIEILNLDPVSKEFSNELKMMLSSNCKWNAVYVDGLDEYLKVRDIISNSSVNDIKIAVTHIDDEIGKYVDELTFCYVQQAGIIGKEAWHCLNRLWQNPADVQNMLVPYKKLK